MNVFANATAGTGGTYTIPLTPLFEEYEATIYENGPLGMRMVKLKEVSSITGTARPACPQLVVAVDKLADECAS